ncbi:hypothetical protein IG626_09520 [Desulfovibrio desulfuricans]|uniref:hypothetical protein n=1 Tax=Desulfovibrio desulfuricans TaxID=876 RepID=UPI00177FFCE9|nr:hypothetical protein [Desulfovibrio desulfuricans]MBD8896240.1 hypothetical protein [Desulfovibrio desulfuricans]
MKEKLTPLTESERELLSRSAAYLEQGIIKDFQFSSRDILRLNATVEAAEARANSLYNKLQIASLKAKQDELAILKEKERAARAKLELERAEAENARLTAELAPIKAVHAIMQTARKAMEANCHE